MAIIYPLTIPGPIYPALADLKKFDGVGEFISPFGGQAEQQNFRDQHWELDLEWPEMTWAQFAGVDAFSGALHGKLGSFVWGPPLATGPRGLGYAAGTPTCAGTDVSGSNTLTTQGWLPNQHGVLLPGDFLALGVYLQLGQFETITRAAGVVTADFPRGGLGFYGTVGEQIWISGPDTDFNGGPFTVLTISTAVNGDTLVTWNQAGANESDVALGTVSGLSPTTRLHQYVGAGGLNSDGGGNASIDIFPSIREAPIAGAAVTLANPQGTFRLAENRRAAPAKKTKTFTFSLKCREAI